MSGSVPISTHLLYSPCTIYVRTPSISVFTCVDHWSDVFSLPTSVLCELDDNTLEYGLEFVNMYLRLCLSMRYIYMKLWAGVCPWDILM